uniref:Uncharacterized protein n=1 Tax=Rhizophora mucronata TaxID=61149 RepID=A0A2P2P3Q2_RHIMU
MKEWSRFFISATKVDDFQAAFFAIFCTLVDA